MPTIKDIAKEAGVSPSTVSNVLNRRGNISSDKIKRVERAAQVMGYHLNDAASALRSGHVKQIAVVLPDIHTQVHADLLTGLRRSAQTRDYAVLLHTTGNVPSAERRIIQEIISSRAECVAVVTSLPDASSRYLPLVTSGARVLFVERMNAGGAETVGFDMREAATALANRVLRDGASRIGLMTGPLIYSNEQLFLEAFTEALAHLAPAVSLHTHQAVITQYTKEAFFFFEGESLDAIVTTSEEMAQAVQAVMKICAPGIPPKLYTLASTRLLDHNDFVRYELNYRLLGEQVGMYLLMRQTKPPEPLADGFGCFAPAVTTGIREKLNILLLDNPCTAAIAKLAPHLSRTQGIDLNIVTMPAAELNRAIELFGETDTYDVLRMDMALLDWYGVKVFEPLCGLPLKLEEIRGRLIPGLEAEYMCINHQMYALPFDPSVQLLFYRQDLFEDTVNQRAFYEQHRRELAVPMTYEELASIAEFFDRRFRSESRTPHGFVMGHMSSEYLANFLSRSPLRMLSGFQTPEMANALKDHIRLEKASYIARQGWWSAAVDAFASGTCAMTIIYSNYAENLSSNPFSRVSGRVGYASVPGGAPLLGGGVLGVSKASKKKETAARFLEWVYSEEISRLLALLGGCSPCISAGENAEVLDLYPWLAFIRNEYPSAVRRDIFKDVARPFNQLLLENNIGFACLNAVKGTMTVDQALAYADASLKRNND